MSKPRQAICHHKTHPSHEIHEMVSSSQQGAGGSAIPHSSQSSWALPLSMVEWASFVVAPLFEEWVSFELLFPLRFMAAFFAQTHWFSAFSYKCWTQIATTGTNKSSNIPTPGTAKLFKCPTPGTKCSIKSKPYALPLPPPLPAWPW